jgi:hypothetical protein
VAAKRGEEVLDDIVGDGAGLAVELLLPVGAPAVRASAFSPGVRLIT